MPFAAAAASALRLIITIPTCSSSAAAAVTALNVCCALCGSCDGLVLRLLPLLRCVLVIVVVGTCANWLSTIFVLVVVLFAIMGAVGWLWFYAATHCLILVVAVMVAQWMRGMPLLIGGGVFSTISNCYWCRTGDPNDAQSDAIVGMPMMMSVEIDPGHTAMSNTVQMTRFRRCCCCFSHYDWPIMLVLVK